MKKLVYTENIEFDMRDWEREPIEKVFAGERCIMAITSDGRTLQKIKDKKVEARTKDWKRIRQIAISNVIQGLAIGLVSDGTCMIAKRPLRKICGPGYRNFSFDMIHNEIKRWTNIVQVEVSDAFFALDADGYVHVSAMNEYTRRDYSDVTFWRNVKRIVTGSQNSLLGITGDGHVLCAGANFKSGPHGDITEKLRSHSGVVDVFPTGSECEQIYFAFRDGSVQDYNGHQIAVKTLNTAVPAKLFDGTFAYNVLILDEQDQLHKLEYDKPVQLFQGEGKVKSFACCEGSSYGNPVVLAVIDY